LDGRDSLKMAMSRLYATGKAIPGSGEPEKRVAAPAPIRYLRRGGGPVFRARGLLGIVVKCKPPRAAQPIQLLDRS
jgi:hypothetical protein